MLGHTGYGGQNSAADTQYRVGWAYLTNYLDPNVQLTGNHRWRPVVESLFSCIHRLEGIQCERKMLTSYQELQEEKSKSENTTHSKL